MKKFLGILASMSLLAISSQATVISFEYGNFNANQTVYSGAKVTSATSNNGTRECLLAMYFPIAGCVAPTDNIFFSPADVIIDVSGGLGQDFLKIQQGSTVLLEGFFTTDLTSIATGNYSLAPVNFTLGVSNIIDEFAAQYLISPGAAIAFSLVSDGQNLSGNGQLASVPEPTAFGLLGLGLLGLGFIRRRKNK